MQTVGPNRSLTLSKEQNSSLKNSSIKAKEPAVVVVDDSEDEGEEVGQEADQGMAQDPKEKAIAE